LGGCQLKLRRSREIQENNYGIVEEEVAFLTRVQY
jgi:hypothetical protein